MLCKHIKEIQMTEEQNSNRKRHTPEEKFKIVKEQLTTKTSVSEICKKYGISPGNFYNWQESFFAGALAGFDKKRGPQPTTAKNDAKVEQLEGEVHRMKDVIAEITAENVAFKKKQSGWPYR